MSAVSRRGLFGLLAAAPLLPVAAKAEAGLGARRVYSHAEILDETRRSATVTAAAELVTYPSFTGRHLTAERLRSA